MPGSITFYDDRVLDASVTRQADGRYAMTIRVKAGKRLADGEGSETAQPIYDGIEVGVFVREPGQGERDQRVLALERKLVTRGEETYTIVVDELPHEVGFERATNSSIASATTTASA